MSEGSINEKTRDRLWVVSFVVMLVVLIVAASVFFYRYGTGIEPVVYVLVLAVLAAASLQDLRVRTVPNWTIIALVVLWIISVWFIPARETNGALGAAFLSVFENDRIALLLDGVLGSAAVGGGMLLLSVFIEARTGRSSFGGGDVKLLFAVGLYLGLPGAVTMLLMACLIAVVLSLVVRFVSPEGFAGRDLNEPFLKMSIPFAPSVAIAVALCLLFGPFSLF